MSALVALTVPLWNWLGLELVLSAVLWAVYTLLARHLATAAERFRFLQLLFVALVLLPFTPAGLPSVWSGASAVPWEILVPFPLSTAARAADQATPAGPGWLAYVAGFGGALYLGWIGRCFIRLGVATWRLHQLVRSAQVISFAAPAPVLLHDRELPPATVGILRPRVLIPRRLYQTLDPRALQLILCHEAVHLRRHDPLFNMLVILLRDALAFSPFVRALARHFESEMELSVDAEVLRHEDVNPREYGQLLLTLVTQLGAAPHPVSGGVFAARSLIKRRISAMSQPATKKSRKTLLIATFIACTSLCGSGISTLRLGPVAWAGSGGATLTKSTAAPSTAALLQVFLVAPGGSRSVMQEDGVPLALSPTPVLTSTDLDSATLQPPAAGDTNPAVGIHLKLAAATKFAEFTGSHLGQRIAILLEGKLLSAPVIRAKIDGGNLMLTGQFPDAMRRLADAINAGQAAPVR